MKRVLVWVLAALTASSVASANVSLKNGNFFVGYVDIRYPGGFEPRIERVYNSKSPYLGWFGWGWGTEYETSLKVAADGSIVVNEFGGGSENRFTPPNLGAKEIEQAARTIADAVRKSGGLASADQYNRYVKRLQEEAGFRMEEWERLRREGKVQVREIPVNTRMASTRFKYQAIVRVAGGYLRGSEEGRAERFDDSGRLVKVSDRNGNYLDFTYGKDGRLQKITDNFNRKIFLTFNRQGRVERIQGEEGKEATFRYNDQNELVQSKDVDGHTYGYAYSSDRRHNLTRISYSDGTAMNVAYYGREQFENVKTLTDRSGTISEYAYENSPAGAYKVSVAMKEKDGTAVSKASYEYTFKRKADGEEWTQRMISNLDGEITDTTYSECCGLPVLIRQAGEETAFEYNARGAVTRKSTPSEVTVLTYDSKWAKVEKVQIQSKSNPKEVRWSEFKYDEKGNLSFAKNSDGNGVKLFYDSNGRIRSLVDQSQRRIDFKYNEHSKPIEITDPQLGSIVVTYGNSGEIKKVDSPSGRKIAMQVSTAFQNLLEIVRPAGVSLSF